LVEEVDQSLILLDSLHQNSAVISIIAFCQQDATFLDIFGHQTVTLEAVIALTLELLLLVFAVRRI
jgi:hypothetical protein